MLFFTSSIITIWIWPQKYPVSHLFCCKFLFVSWNPCRRLLQYVHRLHCICGHIRMNTYGFIYVIQSLPQFFVLCRYFYKLLRCVLCLQAKHIFHITHDSTNIWLKCDALLLYLQWVPIFHWFSCRWAVRRPVCRSHPMWSKCMTTLTLFTFFGFLIPKPSSKNSR